MEKSGIPTMADEVVPANLITFSELCTVLENIQKKKRSSEKCLVLEEFINDFRKKAANITAKKKNCSIFPILRLILPKLERDRKSYDMKENRLGNLLVEVLLLKKTSVSAQKLLNSSSISHQSNGSDFASKTSIIIKNLIEQKPSSLTVGDVNDALDKIASAEAESKKQNQIDAFSYVIKKLTAENFKWFLRIILKDMKLGMGHDKILGTFHPNAPDLYDSCSSLTKVCDELEDGNARPLEMGVIMFYAVTPMLSEPLNSIEKLPADKTYQVETKFDGERFQMHMENEIFEYFSRNGYAYSNQFGKNYESGMLTPRLKNSFRAHVKNFILDGEMMGWHKGHQCFGSKGMNMDIKKITDKSKFTPCFCVYDVLYFNGKSLVGPPEDGGLTLKQRLDILNGIFTDTHGTLLHSKTRITDRSDILDALNKSMANNEEGIVVKDVNSYYIPRRRNAGWYKMKAEYFEGAMTELDLVIIGADEAGNNIRGKAKSFHVACVQEDESGSRNWYCVASVATGLKDAERERLCAKLEEHWTRTKLTPPPEHLHFNKDKPDFWILPEHSTVLQIRASELVRSSEYATSHTLRFPRIVKLRDDKPVQDVMTLQEFNQIVDEMGPVVKLYKDQNIQEQIEKNTGTMLLRDRRTRPAQVFKVPNDLKIGQGHGDEVEVTSKALQDKKILVLTGDEDCPVETLVQIIKQHGGKVVNNWGRDTWCCVAGAITQRVRSHVASGEADVVRAGWLRALPRAAPAPPAPPPPRALLAAAPRTRLLLSTVCDKYFDSYTEPIDPDDLLIRLQIVDYDKSQIYLTTEEMMELDRELFDGTSPHSFLRGCFIYMADDRSVSAFDARMFGAELCSLDDPNLTHVVVKPADPTPLGLTNRNAIVVTKEWLDICIMRKKIVSEENYIIMSKID